MRHTLGRVAGVELAVNELGNIEVTIGREKAILGPDAVRCLAEKTRDAADEARRQRIILKKMWAEEEG